jgi:hypothetical protein
MIAVGGGAYSGRTFYGYCGCTGDYASTTGLVGGAGSVQWANNYSVTPGQTFLISAAGAYPAPIVSQDYGGAYGQGSVVRISGGYGFFLYVQCSSPVVIHGQYDVPANASSFYSGQGSGRLDLHSTNGSCFYAHTGGGGGSGTTYGYSQSSNSSPYCGVNFSWNKGASAIENNSSGSAGASGGGFGAGGGGGSGSNNYGGGGGGGIGIYGASSNGSGGSAGAGGGGGSGGSNGTAGTYGAGGRGGSYGGSSGAAPANYGTALRGTDGSPGFIRILYPGHTRSWPSTNTGAD